jgi:transcriptional regulator with XRE-family HTH domain
MPNTILDQGEQPKAKRGGFFLRAEHEGILAMANTAQKVSSEQRAGSEESVDVSRARLVRRGPVRPARMSLRTLREAAGKTQAQVSKASGIPQPEVSKLETALSFDDRQVSTLRRYLKALGDDLDLVAVSKYGHRIGLTGAPEKPAEARGRGKAKRKEHATAGSR